MTRPALAEVLAVLTERDADWWRSYSPDAIAAKTFNSRPRFDWRDDELAVIFDLSPETRRKRPSRGLKLGIYACARLAITDPREALEVLITRGLLPEHWADPDRAPRWWCGLCSGSQRMRSVQAIGPGGVEGVGPEEPCYCVNERPSLRGLVVVASLGLEALARVEALADVIKPSARVMWMVMGTWQPSTREVVPVSARCALTEMEHARCACVLGITASSFVKVGVPEVTP